ALELWPEPPAWDGARRVEEVAATGAVDTIDFKGQYGFEVKDPEALAALYDHVLAAFPDAYLEDPHDLPEIEQRLGDHLARVSYDAPIRDAEDIGATPRSTPMRPTTWRRARTTRTTRRAVCRPARWRRTQRPPAFAGRRRRAHRARRAHRSRSRTK